LRSGDFRDLVMNGVHGRKRLPGLQRATRFLHHCEKLAFLVIELPAAALIEIDEMIEPALRQNPPARNQSASTLAIGCVRHLKFRTLKMDCKKNMAQR